MDERSSHTPFRRMAPALIALAAIAVLGPSLFNERSAADPQSAPRTAPAPALSPSPAPLEIAAHEPKRPRTNDALEPVVRRAETGAATADSTEPIDCLIEPAQVVDIGSAVIGLIEKVHVERADTVRRGDVLVELESGAERAAVELSRARAAMDGAERAREANVRLGGHREARSRRLFEKQALSLDLREESETAAELARLELQQVREDRRLASLQLDQTEELLRRRTIASPVDGVVVERLMAPGERVDEEVILRIAQLDPLFVELTLPSERFGSVQPGTKAAVELEMPGDQVYVASVTLMDRVIDPASGTFGVRLELPNPDYAIPSGLHCRVRFLAP
jgi:RND family efflux transporter MFP subunit